MLYKQGCSRHIKAHTKYLFIASSSFSVTCVSRPPGPVGPLPWPQPCGAEGAPTAATYAKCGSGARTRTGRAALPEKKQGRRKSRRPQCNAHKIDQMRHGRLRRAANRKGTALGRRAGRQTGSMSYVSPRLPLQAEGCKAPAAHKHPAHDAAHMQQLPACMHVCTASAGPLPVA